MSEPILTLSDVVVAFDALRAVDGVSLAVPRGQRRAIIGPNGAGKTTLFNLLNGFLRRDAGAVTFAGQELGGLKPNRICRLGISRTFQITNLFPSLSVQDNMVLALRGRSPRKFSLFGKPDTDGTEAPRIDAALDAARIAARADVIVKELSYGEQRQLEIALSLVTAPRLLLLDEPAAGLDLGGREELVARLADLAADPDSPALVLVTHHVEEIPQGFSHCLILSEGKAVDSGLLSDVLTAENLSTAFGQSIALENLDGRYFARRTRGKAAHRRRT